MNDALRVVVVVPGYLPESVGGAEQQTRRLAHALVERGVSVTVLAPRLRRQNAARELDGTVTIRRFRLRQQPNLGGRHLASFLKWCGCIGAWLWWHRNEYDVIHIVHGRLHALPAVVVGGALRKPVLVKPGGGGGAHFDLDVVRRKRYFGRFYARSILEGTTAWVAVSREIVEDLGRWGVRPERVHAIPNGVTIPPETRRDDADVVRVISVGRLAPQKAVDAAIEAFAAAVVDGEAHLTIVGDGPCRAELESLSSRLGRDERITFVGSVQDVTPYLQRSDIYISTSVAEGMSNALLEAMACGVVPVTARSSGAADIVDDGGSGFLVPAGDSMALARRLADAIAMPASDRRELGAAARAAMIERFSLEAVADSHVTLYRELAGGAA